MLQRDRGADIVEAKKRRTGDVAGGKRCLRRQVKTATVENVKTDIDIEALETEPIQPRTSGSSSYEPPQSISKAMVVDSMTELTGVETDASSGHEKCGQSSDGSSKDARDDV